MTTGETIAALRRARGMSQEALADALSISRQAVSKWEADIAAPSREKLVELANLFGVSVDALLRPAEAERMQAQTETVAATEACEQAPLQRAQMPRWVLGWLLALTVGLLVCLCWLGAVHLRVGELSSTQTIVTIPAPSDVNQTPAEITEHTIDCIYEPGTYSTASDKLRLQIRVTPREHAIDETAQLLVRGTGSHTVDATWENGAYTAEVSVPLEDSYAVSLAVTIEGVTKTIAIETLYDLVNQYRFSLRASFSGSVQVNDRGRTINGDVLVNEERHDMWSGEGAFLTEASVTLYENGVAGEPVVCAFEPLEQNTVGRTANAHFAKVISDPDAYFLVRAQDNYGREYEQRVELPERMVVLS